MGDLEDLKKEEAKLLAKQSVREDMSANQREKQKVMKRIWALKHPKIVKVVKVGKMSAEGVGMLAKAGFKKAQPYIEQGARNMYENSEQPRQRKVVRVRKSKGKKKKVVKKRRVIRKPKQQEIFGSPFGNPFG